MIKIIGHWRIRTKIIQSKIPFDQQENFYENVPEIFVAPCVEHPLFKDNFGRRHTDPPCDLRCECSKLSDGRCENCKTRCYLINFNSAKMKVTKNAKNIELISLNDYLKKIKSMLFFSFCNFCKNVKCSLDNPDYFDELESKKVFGEL